MARERKSPFVAVTRFAFRTPLLPLSTFCSWADDPSLEALRAKLAGWLKEPAIIDAIFVASPDLYESLSAWHEQPDSVRGQRVERSLVRYLARMSARSTPFGLFAAVSTGRFADSGEESQIALPARARYRRSTRIDNDFLFALCEAVAADPEVRRSLEFRVNSSLYDAAGRLRYAESRMAGKSRSHHLIAVEPTEYLERTLARAATGSSIESLATALAEDDDEIALDEATLFIDELVDSQLLVSDLSPNVTGDEPIVHTLQRLREAGCEPIAERLASAGEAIEAIDRAGLGAAPKSYKTIASTLAELPPPLELGRLFQVDMVVEPTAAVLHRRVLHEIERAVATLASITEHQTESSITRFRDAFVARYESREVPLAIALDADIGVGFDVSRAPGAEAAPLLADLNFPENPNRGSQVAWSSKTDHLLGLLTDAARASAHEIVLSKTDIGRLAADEPARLPDAFSLMATVIAAGPKSIDRGDFSIIVEGGGGPSGANILGRFCHASADHRALVRDHLRQEEALRPGAVFAEIVHLPEGRIGNILCRPVLRGYEIPFLGVSGAPTDNQIPIADLLVSVRRDRVVLRSARLGCEVIPRLTTAHNYTLRSLGIYRFLCSLQSQARDNFSWSWGPLAGAAFLPRVRFGRLVFSRARWLIGSEQLKPLAEASKGAKKATTPEKICELRERMVNAARALQANARLPRFVVVSDGDNELPVDFDNPLSLESFVALVKGRKSTVLTELYPGPDEIFLEGASGKHCHQIVVPLVRARAPEPSQLAPMPQVHSGRYAIGSRWIYAKLYTGSSSADDVLSEVIWPLAKRALAGGAADKWFFIRYADPEWHLRVRFAGHPDRLRSGVLAELESEVATLSAAGTVWKFQLDTYEQESDRYGGSEGIELAEELFWIDSEAVCEIVELLDGDEGAIARWQLCLRGIDMLLDDFGFELADKRSLIGRARAGFGAEFHADTGLQKQLGKRYRDNTAIFAALLARDPGIDAEHDYEPGFEVLARRSPRLRNVVARLRQRHESLTTSIGDIAMSVVHMHANRLLRSAHRAQELVLYDFLKRHYDMLSARQKRAAKG